MSDVVTDVPTADPHAPVLTRLSTLNRFLPVWIIAALALGIGLGRAIPSLSGELNKIQIGSVSLPIAIGLLLMMYPVLAKVRYTQLGRVTGDRRLLLGSLVLNWIIGPALMFALAWLLLPDLPEYRTGLIIVGLARCIAMVLIWNELACGDREAAAVLVAINSVFQILAFAGLGWFYLQVLPRWLGLSTTSAHFSIAAIALSVLVFLGIPLVAGYLTRTIGERTKGRNWYETRFLPKIGPVALYGLLFTIVVLFALQGHTITSKPWDVVRIAFPLLAYFAIMFAGGFSLGRSLHLGYAKTTTLAFTAAGNNFELAIAVAIGTFGVTSGQALAGVVGPLIEVPVLVALVYVALWLRRHYPAPPSSPDPIGQTRVRANRATTRQPQRRRNAMTHKPTVLFVCVHNAGRSQMAAGWLKQFAGDRVEIWSAGSEPAHQINPIAVEAMREVGIDISGQTPKILTTDSVSRADVVITMSCGDTCPYFPGKRYEDWALTDPAGQPLEAVREIRDDIRDRINALATQLLPVTHQT